MMIDKYSYFLLMCFVSVILLLTSGQVMENWNQCPSKFGTWNMIHSILIATVLISSGFLRIHLHSLCSIISILIILWDFVGLFFMARILIYNITCINVVFRVIFICYFAMFVSAMIIMLITAIQEITRIDEIYVVQQRDEGERLVDIESEDTEENGDELLLKHFYDTLDEMSSEQIAEFLNETLPGDRLEKVKLMKKDEDLLELLCLQRFQGHPEVENGGQNTASDCIICKMNFDDGVEVLLHPGCDHRYHWTCLDSWLKIKRTCPYCHRGTRRGLIQEFVRQRNHQGEVVPDLGIGDVRLEEDFFA